MNKRIKELAKQAGWSSFEVLDERNQKFAELIVRECAKIVNANDCEGSIVGDGMLFEHFGVEE